MREAWKLIIHLLSRVGLRLRAMRRLGRRVAPRVPTWGWAMVWLRSSFLPSQNYLIILAVVIGVLTGLGSVGFIKVLDAIAEFARDGVAGAEGIWVFGYRWTILERFGSANLVLLPALGGLLVGPLINRFAPEAKGHGVPEVMTALATRGGRIRKRVVTVKVIASSMTIGFGGAAGGVAATFNAPIAGAIFSMGSPDGQDSHGLSAGAADFAQLVHGCAVHHRQLPCVLPLGL